MGLTHSPGLQLVHRIAGGIEVVMPGDLGQFGVVEASLTLVFIGPAEEFTLGLGLTCRVGR